jgi:hypothetical protein
MLLSEGKKTYKVTSVAEDTEILEALCIAGGNIKWYSYHGKQCGSSSKQLNSELPYDSAFHFCVYTPNTGS